MSQLQTWRSRDLKGICALELALLLFSEVWAATEQACASLLDEERFMSSYPCSIQQRQSPEESNVKMFESALWSPA